MRNRLYHMGSYLKTRNDSSVSEKKRYGFSRGTQPQNQKKMRRTMPITFTPAELTHDAPQIYQRNEKNQGCCHSGTTIGEYDLRGKNPIRVVHPIPKAQKIIKIGCTWYHIKIFGRCNMDGLDCRWCGKLPFTHGSETNIYIYMSCQTFHHWVCCFRKNTGWDQLGEWPNDPFTFDRPSPETKSHPWIEDGSGFWV